MAITVTATQGGSTSNGLALRVKVLTSAAVTQNGATATQAGAAAHQATITTTVAGSQVYAAADNGSGGTSFTANANTTQFDDIADTTNAEHYATGRTTSATGTPGAISVGWSAPSGGGGCALAEILPAGTLAEDASGPAVASTTTATTVTTASFTPPAGALLVAMVASDGGSGVTTMTVSDSSGLTWTELAKSNASSDDYAGIWIAQVPASGVTSVAPRYGQAAAPSWAPWAQKDRRDANTAGTPANPLPSPLDSAWQAEGPYRHLYGDAHLRDRRAYFYQRPLVSDPNLLAPAVDADPLALNPEQSDSSDAWRGAAVPAFCDRRLVPQQRTYYDTTLLSAAELENELLGGADTGRHYTWHTDRRQVPQQRPYVSDPSVLATAQLENELLGGAQTWARYVTSAYIDRREVPQQRPYISDPLLLAAAQLENELLGGADTARHYLTSAYIDRREVPQQRSRLSDPSSYPPPNPLDPLLAGQGWLDGHQHQAATHADRREVPQQRLYPDQQPFTLPVTATGSAVTEAWWGTDPDPFWKAQRPYISDPSLLAPPVPPDLTLSALLPLWLARNTAATHADRREVPAQRPYVSDPSSYPAEVQVGAGTTEAWWGADTDAFWKYQRPYVSDPSSYPAAALDPVLTGWAPRWLAWNTPAVSVPRWQMPQQPARLADPLLIGTALLENELLGGAGTLARYLLAATHADRREVPAQRPYVSDPSSYPPGAAPVTGSAVTEAWWGADTEAFYKYQKQLLSDPSSYPAGAPADPLTVAWGAGGNYWHLYNRAADATGRRLVPQQRPYISNPALLATAQLENELLGGAGTLTRYLEPATHYDRRQAGQQRTYPAGIDTPFDPTTGARADLRRRWVTPATHADRRLYPQQRQFWPLPQPPPPFTIGVLTAAGAPLAVLTAADAPGGAAAGTLTAADQRTGGPGG